MGQYEPFGERGNGEKINIYVCIILSYFFSLREYLIGTTDTYSNDSYIRLLEKHNKSFLYL